MNSITKRLAQMSALYLAKEAYKRFDAGAAKALGRQLYNTSPHEWQQTTRRMTQEAANAARTDALHSADSMLDRLGLMRSSRRPSAIPYLVLGAAGGVALSAGGVWLLRSASGKRAAESIRRRVADFLSGEDEAVVDTDGSGTSELRPAVAEAHARGMAHITDDPHAPAPN